MFLCIFFFIIVQSFQEFVIELFQITSFELCQSLCLEFYFTNFFSQSLLFVCIVFMFIYCIFIFLISGWNMNHTFSECLLFNKVICKGCFCASHTYFLYIAVLFLCNFYIIFFFFYPVIIFYPKLFKFITGNDGYIDTQGIYNTYRELEIYIVRLLIFTFIASITLLVFIFLYSCSIRFPTIEDLFGYFLQFLL